MSVSLSRRRMLAVAPKAGRAMVLAAIWLAAHPVWAHAEEGRPEPESFLSRTEPAQVELGRSFLYLIEVRHQESETYDLPSPLAMGTLSLRKVEKDRSASGEQVVTTFRIEAAIFDALGETSIPDVELLVARDGVALPGLLIPGASITVRETSQGDELAPLPPPKDVQVVAWDRILGAASVLLLALLGFLLYRIRKTRVSPSVVEARIPPGERALSDLASLEADALWDGGQGRLHYFRLSEIVRRYFFEAHGMAATEMTSDELMKALRLEPLPGLEARRAESWIRRGDLARFAKGLVDPEAAKQDLEEARAMIQGMEIAKRRQAPEEESA